jgi:hypothetical protein
MLCRIFARRRILGHRSALADALPPLVGDLFGRMLGHLGGSGGCFATFVVLAAVEPLAL